MSMSMNKMQGLGNLTRDGELKYIPNGKAVLAFSVALNERFQDKDTSEWKDGETFFLECELWGKPAEKMAPMLTKGRLVFVEGKLKLEKWKDKEDGSERSKVRCTAFTVLAIDKPLADGEKKSEAPAQRQPARQPQRASAGLDDSPRAGF